MYPFLEDTWEKSRQIEFLKEDGKKKSPDIKNLNEPVGIKLST